MVRMPPPAADVSAAAPAAFDPESVARRLDRPDVVAELLFPIGASEWVDGRLRLQAAERASVRTQISGVRLHAADPHGEDLSLERQCQDDVGNLVAAVRDLRAVPGCAGLVLAPETLRCRQPDRGRGVRVKFGLACGPRATLADDARAARTCHRRIVRAVHRAGLVVEHPRRFDPRTGLAGLEAWGRALRLRRRRRWWPLLLLLPLLLRDCSGPASFFGVAIETRTLVVVVDKSSSMQHHFGAVRAEARRVLDRLLASGGERFADVIAYDAGATSALGRIERVDAATAERLLAFLDGLQAGGGTQLATALALAAEEIVAHGEPATLVVLTDARDATIAEMLAALPALRDRFQDVEVVLNGFTPRLFDPQQDPTPNGPDETRLRDLATALGGRLGPEGDRP